MRIQHNIMAMNSYRNYTANNSALGKNLEKLSSGYKINRAGDDAAGLAISEKMRAQITGLQTAQSNAQSGINLVQTAEGALTEVHDMLNRMVELADQSANGTFDNITDRANLQKEFNQLRTEIDRIAEASNFNGQKLLEGSLSVATENKAAANTSATIDATKLTASSVLKVNDYTIKFDGADSDTASATAGKVITIAMNKNNGDARSAAEVATALAGAVTTAKATKDGITAGVVNGTTNTQVDITSDVITTLNMGSDASVTETLGNKEIKKGDGGLILQIGDTSDKFNQITLDVGSVKSAALGISSLDISGQPDAANAVATLKTAINTVSGIRGDLGATQNRLEHTINNLSVMTENIQDAESNIRDVDVASEMMEYAKNNILVQSAQAMLAQANQAPQGVLQLLQ